MSLALIPVYESEEGDLVPLTGSLSETEIARFLHSIATYAGHDSHPEDEAALLSWLAESGERVLPGGLLALRNGVEIEPGCCCGLEDWRQWFWVAEGNDRVTFGHDPLVWFERSGASITIHASVGNEDNKAAPYTSIVASQEELHRALLEASSAAEACQAAIGRYLQPRDPTLSLGVLENLNRWFEFDL